MNLGLAAIADIDSSFDLANALHEAGVSVTLYLPHGRTIKSVNANDKPVETIYAEGLLYRDIRVRLIKYPRMRNPRSFVVVRQLIRNMHEDGVNLVHILGGNGELWLAVLACLLRHAPFSPRIPVITTMIIPKPNIGDQFPIFVNVGVNRMFVYGSDMVIVNGKSQIKLVEEMYGIPARRIMYIPLYPRTTALRWSSQKRSEEPGNILFFGGVQPRKGLEYLIRAQPLITNQVPHSRIVIAGHGDELDRCLKLIQDSSKFEIHPGYSTGSQMAAFFERASLVALPYISASTSGILGTAYAFAKPVVATDVGCLPEYVHDGVTGFLVPPADEKSLANAIIRLLKDDMLRLKMGENAKKWVDEEQQKIIDELLFAYEKAQSLHRGTRRRGFVSLIPFVSR